MKTPREILLGRHQAVETKLDAICESVLERHLGASDEKERTAESRVSLAVKLWQELVWPCRRIWAGMAAVWVVIVVVGMATGEREAALAEVAPPPDEMMALKEQRQMMAQLLDVNVPMPMDRPRVPGPRSEQRPVVMLG